MTSSVTCAWRNAEYALRTKIVPNRKNTKDTPSSTATRP